MTTPINNSPASCCHQNTPRLAPQDKRLTSYREATSLRREAAIELTTIEGDVVTISALQEYAASNNATAWATPLQRGLNFTSTQLSASSLSLSVAGDLNQEELADIAELIDDLSAIAGDFYSGNMGQAMNRAMEIGDMGTISRMSASFSSRESWSLSQLTDYHPLPSAEDLPRSLAENFSEIASIVDEARTDEIKYAEMLQAQWQQVKNFLEAREMTAPTGEKAFRSRDDADIPAVRRMHDRIQEMADKHPRLAPFGLAVAHQAINRVEEKLPAPPMPGLGNTLKDTLLAEFNNWLYEA